MRTSSLVLLLFLGLLAACATAPLPGLHPEDEQPDAPDLLLHEMGLGDPRFQGIAGFEHVMVDPSLRWRMEEYGELAGVTAKKAFIRRFLKDANSLNNQVVTTVLERVPAPKVADTLARFLKEHPEAAPAASGSTPREQLARAYTAHSVKELEEESRGLASINTEEDADRTWQALTSQVEESIKTRGRVSRLVAHAPLVPFIYAWIWYHAETDDRNPHLPNFEMGEIYRPAGEASRQSPGEIRDPQALLRYYAPVLVQEVKATPPYPQRDDRIGQVGLIGDAPEEARPMVDTDRPTVYAYTEIKNIQSVPTRQLVYVIWYPEHPALKTFDPEAGILEGWTLRLTLDAAHRPLVYESVSNCGCYYKIFPIATLEAWSRQAFPSRLAGKRFHLEQEVAGIDAVVPEVIPPGPQPAPTLYYSAGHHQLVTLRQDAGLLVDASRLTTKSYRLAPYEELENLPLRDRKASLFDQDGLVRQAHRPECELLAPSGLYHAGHPRQRGTQMIYFDQADFEDPNLLPKYLRLPDRVFARERDS